MITFEESLKQMQLDNFNGAVSMFEQALQTVVDSQDIVKQKYAAAAFDVSVNSLKSWVKQGCPEIRLESGMVLYSKKAIREWLLQYQK
ncbi:DNA-binding protein [Enterococcus asini]|uniref:DNA-binding protein n=1 Tax=Enterococcus asini TaxID=57732 RepID=UPI001E3FB6EF|nr:DNA-binding protein [Enterococcus asini]MCD5030358.1 DNA-binding protein [Enterococcus asini]